MKVLSLTEPYATLILNGSKRIETRSWKTNYRGELYIHASMTKPSKTDLENNELMSLLENRNFNYGNIICKCKLVDCIYMTKEYVEKMKTKNRQEYICGDYKKGRYAWILEDITPLENPIKAKGQLSIWNYYNELEIMERMENIEYGWIDKKNQKHTLVDDSYEANYRLQTPKEIIENKIGVCWDQVEIERYYFKGTPWNVKTYFIVHYDEEKCPTHTFLTYEKNNKYYWFEHAWATFKGIHEYKTQQELLLDVQDKFIAHELNNRYKKNNLCVFLYCKPPMHSTVAKFYKHCEAGTQIFLEKKENK